MLPGDQLMRLCEGARDEAVLVAPFIKAGVLARLLALLGDGVALRCFTRWRPDEILAGVSDLAVWPLMRDRPGTTLWLRPDLHAKYYRGDDLCLVGSANLTATALGWSPRPNLELLVRWRPGALELAGFEAALAAGSVQVDDTVHGAVGDAVRQIAEHSSNPPGLPGSIGDDAATQCLDGRGIGSGTWVPTLRTPESLFTAYAGRGDRLSAAARDTALADLCALAIPPGLSRRTFEAYVGALLLQMPIVGRVDTLVATPQRFGAVRRLLRTLPCAEQAGFDAGEAWQTLMRWLRHFLPGRYGLSVPNYSEVFYRIAPRPTEAGVE